MDGMPMDDLKTTIRAAIAGIVGSEARATGFRPPLAGFADAGDSRFLDLKSLIDADHLLPTDLLPGARTVVSFFLPFAGERVRGNQQGPEPTPDWAIGQKEADELIDAVVQGIRDRLAPLGIACSGNPESAPYDPARLFQFWSQRHVGFICGLGSIGLNQLLITSQGCAGRLGSFCLSAPVEPDPVCREEYCPGKADGSCGACLQRCPVGALAGGTIDKRACDAWITDFTNRHFQGRGAYRACGKCITWPCALERPRASHPA